MEMDWDRYAPQAQGLLRIFAALLFIEHGTSKLFGFPPFTMGEMPAMGSLLWIGAVIELVGGLLVLIGFLTRPAALIMSGEMAVAYWMAHAPKSTFPAENGGDAAILFCFIFLFLAAAGPGAWSVDESRARRVVRTDPDPDTVH
ncbi:MAG: DoxX family protein [Sphingomicrobium sp.]